MALELVNSVDERTFGVMTLKYDDPESVHNQPLIMWNLELKSYIHAPSSVSSYRSYRCLIKMASGQDFMVNILANDFHNNFKKVHDTIVNKTHGVLVLQKPIDNSLWTEFVPKLLLESSHKIYYQRPAINTGLCCAYLEEKSFNHGGELQQKDAEFIFGDVVYDAEGFVKEKPIHVVIPEAYPHKRPLVSPHSPSGLFGLLLIIKSHTENLTGNI